MKTILCFRTSVPSSLSKVGLRTSGSIQKHTSFKFDQSVARAEIAAIWLFIGSATRLPRFGIILRSSRLAANALRSASTSFNQTQRFTEIDYDRTSSPRWFHHSIGLLPSPSDPAPSSWHSQGSYLTGTLLRLELALIMFLKFVSIHRKPVALLFPPPSVPPVV